MYAYDIVYVCGRCIYDISNHNCSSFQCAFHNSLYNNNIIVASHWINALHHKTVQKLVSEFHSFFLVSVS